MKHVLYAVAAALACSGSAHAAVYASATVNLTISGLYGSPGLLIDTGALPVDTATAQGGSGTASVADSLAFGDSILTASAGAETRTGEASDFGSATAALDRTITLVNTLPWLATVQALITYDLAASVFADTPGGTLDGTAWGETGTASATLRVTRQTTDAAGAVSSYEIVPARTISVDQTVNGLVTYPVTGPATFAFVLGLEPGSRDVITVGSLVSAEVVKADLPTAEPPSPVPLPGTAALLAAALGMLGRRRLARRGQRTGPSGRR